MANEDLITFEDLYLAGLKRVKGDPQDEESLSKFKEILNTRQKRMCSLKKWKFLRVTDRSLKLPKKITTGTVSVPYGSRIITGVGTDFQEDNRSWFISFTGLNSSYRVVSITSATELIISSPFTETSLAGVGYRLYQSELALFPDLEDIDDIRIDGWSGSLVPKGPALINAYRQRFPDMEGRPKIYSIEGKAIFSGTLLQDFVLGYDFLGSGDVKSMSFFPHIPDKDYTIQIAYKKKVTAMKEATDEPIIPEEYRHVLFNYALSDWYYSNDAQRARDFKREADEGFKEMVSKYLDTDDVLHFYPKITNQFSRDWLLSHSSNFFDTEW